MLKSFLTPWLGGDRTSKIIRGISFAAVAYGLASGALDAESAESALNMGGDGGPDLRSILAAILAGGAGSMSSHTASEK